MSVLGIVESKGRTSMKHHIRNLFVAGAVALSLGTGAFSAGASEFINVLTGGTSGVYYPLGAALAKIYGDKIEGARTQVQATKASVENLNLLQQGKGEIAFALGDSVQAAWEGNEEAGFKKKLDKLRGIAAIYPNYIQIVASKDSGITDLASLKGKRVSVGAPKSGTELNARAILEASAWRRSRISPPRFRSRSSPFPPPFPKSSARRSSPRPFRRAPMKARRQTCRRSPSPISW
jgi:TRAP transporter TAXI family solute receptor